MEIESTEELFNENEEKIIPEISTYLETVETQIWKIECEIAFASNILTELKKLKDYLSGDEINEELPTLSELKKIRSSVDFLISKKEKGSCSSTITKATETELQAAEIIEKKKLSSETNTSYSKVLQQSYKTTSEIAIEWQQLSIYKDRINSQIYFHTVGKYQVTYIYGNTDESLVQELYKCSLIRMIYLEDGSILKSLPKPIMEATEAFQQILRHWNLYLKIIQTYPQDGSIALIQIGISSEPFTPKYKPLEVLHPRSTAEELFQLWIETKKIDIANIWVYHSSDKMFIYSHSKQPTKRAHELQYEKWINLFRKNNLAISKEAKKLFCEKMQKERNHKCIICQKKETLEEIRTKLQAERIQSV